MNPPSLSESQAVELRSDIAAVSAQSPWGWGHTINLGDLNVEGFLGTDYLSMIGAIDRLGWWPPSLAGLQIADVGCFSGGVSAILAGRGAQKVFAIDEIPEHIDQCRIVVDTLSLGNVETHLESAYNVDRITGGARLDGIFLGGVLYHMSDMLTGLVTLRRALRPGGWLILESNVDESETQSFANFGRFYAGMWWQPSVLAVRDLLEFAGYTDIKTEVFRRGRVVAKGVNSGEEMRYRRGLPLAFDDIHDAEERTLDRTVMSPANAWRSYLRAGVRTVVSRVTRGAAG